METRSSLSSCSMLFGKGNPSAFGRETPLILSFPSEQKWGVLNPLQGPLPEGVRFSRFSLAVFRLRFPVHPHSQPDTLDKCSRFNFWSLAFAYGQKEMEYAGKERG